MMMNCGKANMSNFRRIFLSSTGSMYISTSPTADNGLALVSSGTFILSGLSIFGEDEDGYRSRTWREANGFDWYEKIGTQIYDLGVKSRVVVSVGTPFRLQSEPLGRMLMNEDKRTESSHHLCVLTGDQVISLICGFFLGPTSCGAVLRSWVPSYRAWPR